ncbi:hypothetical protein ACFQZZ_31570 [Nocardia sp. GCM10030253]|uniref:hypothetical protein n=1 Tax=Nocardia sp. GCM10030253 TaxID=3273404 RepID=UPI00363D02E7
MTHLTVTCFSFSFYDNALWKPQKSGTHTRAALQGLAYEIKVNVGEPTLTGSATCGAGPLGFMGS